MQFLMRFLSLLIASCLGCEEVFFLHSQLNNDYVFDDSLAHVFEYFFVLMIRVFSEFL